VSTDSPRRYDRRFGPSVWRWLFGRLLTERRHGFDRRARADQGRP
jgi:hypothetical protein